jgi:hypothetical protein
MPPAAQRRMSQTSGSAFDACAHPDEDWTKISDFGERRRIQSRIAQRKYRKWPSVSNLLASATTQPLSYDFSIGMQKKIRSRQQDKETGPTSPTPDMTHEEGPATSASASIHSQTDREQRPVQNLGDRRMSETSQQPFLTLDEDYDTFLREFTPQLSASLPLCARTLNPRPLLFPSQPDGQQQQRPSEADKETAGFHIPTSFEQDKPSQPRSAPSAVATQLPQDSQTALIDAYFAHSHAVYPIISEERFRAGLADQNGSALLLSAVLYAGALHAPESVIHHAGFESRQACLGSLYGRAKRSFFEGEDDIDIDHQFSRVQAAFLLHTVWPVPTATMDPWTWLGLAIRLAQKMGMHRRATKPELRDDGRKSWKRTWWLLFVSLYRPTSVAPTAALSAINHQDSRATPNSPVT